VLKYFPKDKTRKTPTKDLYSIISKVSKDENNSLPETAMRVKEIIAPNIQKID
jgi:hypothetical protein|tara:strand:+ start:310 stop:468 length:159 start_codon:yes stop_codon:yes gene_type:complete